MGEQKAGAYLHACLPEPHVTPQFHLQLCPRVLERASLLLGLPCPGSCFSCTIAARMTCSWFLLLFFKYGFFHLEFSVRRARLGARASRWSRFPGVREERTWGEHRGRASCWGSSDALGAAQRSGVPPVAAGTAEKSPLSLCACNCRGWHGACFQGRGISANLPP